MYDGVFLQKLLFLAVSCFRKEAASEMFDWILSLLFVFAAWLLVTFVVVCDQVIFEFSLYVLCVYAFLNLKQSLEKSYFLDTLMKLHTWM